MRRLIVGDVHGNFKALSQCLQKCKFENGTDEIYFIGDLVDGMPDSYEVIDLLTILDPDKLFLVLGNHDAWFIEWLNTGKHPDNWSHGGYTTALSYCKNRGVEDSYEIISSNTFSGRSSIKQYIFKLDNIWDIPLAHERILKNNFKDFIVLDDDKLLVHGGFNRYNHPIIESTYNLTWDRNLWNQALEHSKEGKELELPGCPGIKEVFIGHTSTTFWGEYCPMYAGKKVWNLDTGAGEAQGKGCLTVMDIDTKEWWSSDSCKELYPDHNWM